MKNAMDLLIDKIKEKNNPTVMGLDPRYEMLPECIKSKYGKDVKSVCEGILEYNKNLRQQLDIPRITVSEASTR